MCVALAGNAIHFERERVVPLTYLRITNIRTGLMLNFDRQVLREAIKRFVL